MALSMPYLRKHCLFQVNHHVQTSLMLLSIMDSAELDLNNANLSSSTVDSEDYDKGLFLSISWIASRHLFHLDLRLAAELGRYLLERNQELQNYINVLQKQLDDQQCDMQVRTRFIKPTTTIPSLVVITFKISLNSRAIECEM